MFGGSACGWVVGASGLKRADAVAVVWVGFTGVSLLSLSLERERLVGKIYARESMVS